MTRRALIVSAAPALVALLVSGCDRLTGAEPEADEPARLVVTERAAVEDAVDRVGLLGDVHGEREVQVFSQVPERVRVLHVQDGDRVEAGDPIVTLDADLQSSGLQQASAALGAAEAARDQLGAELARVRRLVGSGAVPRSQLETLEAQLRTSEAQVDQMRAARRTAGEQRSRTVIRAPIEGTVALLEIDQGAMVAPSVPICSVVQAERVVVELRVTEQDYVRLREGMGVELRPPALPDVVRRGTVSHIAPVIHPITRTALVEVTVDNDGGLLRPGMVAEASIELSRRPDVVLAPSRALVLGARTDSDREASVFVVEGGVAHRRRVILGPRYGRRVEVTEGLEGGEELVVRGQHLLRDGAPVRTGQSPPVAAAETP